MRLGHVLLGGAIALAAIPQSASAAITWTDWTHTGTDIVFGTVGGVAVSVESAPGGIAFAQTNGGFDFWNSTGNSTWDSLVAPPPGSDLVALNAGGVKKITFGSTVQDVYLALTSWQGQQKVVFDRPFTQEGWVRGCGYWGCGLLTNVTATSFTSNNEAHGILKFAGPINSLTFSESNNEFWHGIQVGIGGAVPEPSAWALLILGFGAVGAGMRRRTRTSFSFA